MWRALALYAQAAADSSAVDTVLVPVIGAVVVVVAAVITGLFTLRGSTRSADAQRETAFDQRVDGELTRLRADNDRLQAIVDQQQVQLIRARYVLAAHRIDPAELDPWEATPRGGRHRAGADRGTRD